jgi:hypothetical protein
MMEDRIGDYYLEAEIRLAEAKRSLERMNTAQNGTDLKAAFVSFLELTKNIFFPLKRYANILGGYKEWWADESGRLANNPIATFFYHQRNDVVKGANELIRINSLTPRPGGSFSVQGPLMLYEGMFYRQLRSGRFIPHEAVSNIVLEWDFDQKPIEKAPSELCREYIRLLEGILESFVKKFPGLERL